MMKRNEGFTLVELLVAMVVGSIVTLAATSVLLLGLRYNAISIGAAQRQNTTRIIMSLLEGVASEGIISEVDSRLDGWVVHGQPEGEQIKGPIILQYIAKDRIICTSDTNNPLLEGVIASQITISDKGLLTVSVETEDGSYVSSIHCRTFDLIEGNDQSVQPTLPEEFYEPPENPTNQKDLFIQALLSQYPENGMPNPGVILDEDGVSTSWYYAQWYIGSQTASGWDSSTPWCACYISWALVESRIPSGVDGRDKWYANVDEFMEYFTNGSFNETASWSNASPATGDLVFFDWEGGNDPEHVGVVLMENGDFIYTIEGNSAGLVAMRMYSAKDPAIIGYGKLNFSSEEQTNQLTGLKKLIFEEINRRCVSTIEYEYILDSQADDCAANDRNPENETWSWGEILRCVKGVDQGQGLNIVSMVDRWIAEYPGIAGESPLATHCVIGVSGTGDETKIIVVFTGPRS